MLNKLQVTDNGRQITKYFEDSKLLELEKKRTVDAYKICLNCDFLQVPKIIATDENSFTSLYYPNAARFADLITDNFDRALQTAPLVARALIYLQNNLKHEEKLIYRASELETEDPNCFVHGDFTVHNLLLDENNLILVDWASSEWGGQQFNNAPLHWDLVWFLSGLYLIPNNKTLNFANKDLLAQTILDEYLQQGHFPKPEKLRSFAIAHSKHFHRYSCQQSAWYSNIKHYKKWYQCRKFWKNAFKNQA